MPVLPYVQIIRVCIDVVIALLAFHYTKRYVVRLAQDIQQVALGQPSARSLSFASAKECVITTARLGIQLAGLSGSLKTENPTSNLYISLEIKGAFEVLAILLPHNIGYKIDDEIDGVQISANVGDSSIRLIDTRKDREQFTLPNSFTTFDAYVQCERARRRFSLNLYYAWVTGAPYEDGKWFPMNEFYVPAVDHLEIDIDYAHGKFVPDLSRTFPPPEAIVGTQLRWISKRGLRSHSSVVAAFIDEQQQQIHDREVFRAGVIFAIAVTIVVTAAMDALWTILDILFSAHRVLPHAALLLW